METDRERQNKYAKLRGQRQTNIRCNLNEFESMGFKLNERNLKRCSFDDKKLENERKHF